jgi:ribonuclease BN (tRNA processing enzyme)
MDVTFVGTGCGVPQVRRGSPSIIVNMDGRVFLFDSGPGALRMLLRAGYTYLDIDTIFYTHFHVDHTLDLAAFLFASKYELKPRERDLTIIGPPGIKEFYYKLIDLYGEQIVSTRYRVAVMDVMEMQERDIETRALPHTRESIGYRLIDKKGKVLVYSGDTDYSKSIVELGRDADALILECSFPKKVKGHLTPELAGRIARESHSKRLILTHFYPVYNGIDIISFVREEFSGEIVLAEDLMHIRV